MDPVPLTSDRGFKIDPNGRVVQGHDRIVWRQSPHQSNDQILEMIRIHGTGLSGIGLGDEESTQTVKRGGEQYHCGVKEPPKSTPNNPNRPDSTDLGRPWSWDFWRWIGRVKRVDADGWWVS